MKRRAVFGMLAGAVVWPLVSRTQQTDRILRVGVLLLFAENDPEAADRVLALKLGLHDLGWIEGRNVQIECRFAAGDIDRVGVILKEFGDLPVDVIVTNSIVTNAGPIQTLTKIPIVFAMVHSLALIEPGLRADLSHPGANFTGVTNGFEPSIVDKWLELLKAIAPGVTRVGLIFNPDVSRTWPNWSDEFVSVASSFSFEPVALRVHDVSDLQGTLMEFARAPGSAVIVMPDVFTVGHHAEVVWNGTRYNLPACYPFRYFATDGGLMSYGANGAEVSRQAASYVDHILKGTHPGDLPIQQPNAFELVINLKTAKAIGLAVPPWMVARADEVIE
jgi:putative tryptophan/tyrosine transport system substrate-binding protein